MDCYIKRKKKSRKTKLDSKIIGGSFDYFYIRTKKIKEEKKDCILLGA